MKMEVISARGSYIDAPPVLYRNEELDGPILLGGFADLPLSLAKYSFINLSVVPDKSFGSYTHEIEKFDGMIGSIQANRSDYSLTPTAIDFTGLCDYGNGVILTKFLDQQIYTLASSPNQNTTARSLDVHELFLVLDRASVVSIIISFVILICWFKLLCLICGFVVNKKGFKRLKLSYGDVTWYLYCCMTRQTSPSQVPITRSHQELTLILRYVVLFLACITFSGMSTEIVVFTPPPLIHTLQELLDSDKVIVFDSASQIAEIMKKSAPGSAMNDVFVKAMKQSLLTGQDPVIDVSKSENFMSLVQRVISQNRAYVALEIPIKIFRALHCIHHRKSSKYFQSNEPYHMTMMGLFFNEYASKSLVSRVERTYSRAMAGGLFGLQVDRSPQAATSLFGEPSTICLNEYEWDQTTVNGVQSFAIILFIPILQFLTLLMVVSFITLVLESIQMIASKFVKRYF